MSGTRRNGRTELQVLLNFLQPGDTLVVTRVDRLARSIRDLQNIVHELPKGEVTLKATEQPIDTRTGSGKAFLDMLGVFAEFETNLGRERQLEGIAAAKARGVYKGRKRSINPRRALDGCCEMLPILNPRRALDGCCEMLPILRVPNLCSG